MGKFGEMLKGQMGNAIGGAMSGAIGTGLGLLFGKSQDKRQLNQQQKLTDMQQQANKEMADYNKNISLDYWNKTNYGAQMEHIKNAGLNPALIYGTSGTGGSTISGTGSGVSGGQAANAAQTQAMALQHGLMKAQIDNINADTENKKASAGVGGQEIQLKEFQNAINKIVGAQDMAEAQYRRNEMTHIEAEKLNAMWEAEKKGMFNDKTFDDAEAPLVKAIKAGYGKVIQDLQNAKTSGNIMQAEAVIKGYQADLAKQGIPPDTPWYYKIIGDILGRIGLNPLKK